MYEFFDCQELLPFLIFRKTLKSHWNLAKLYSSFQFTCIVMHVFGFISLESKRNGFLQVIQNLEKRSCMKMGGLLNMRSAITLLVSYLLALTVFLSIIFKTSFLFSVLQLESLLTRSSLQKYLLYYPVKIESNFSFSKK